jgi:hypothetical protein
MQTDTTANLCALAVPFSTSSTLHGLTDGLLALKSAT